MDRDGNEERRALRMVPAPRTGSIWSIRRSCWRHMVRAAGSCCRRGRTVTLVRVYASTSVVLPDEDAGHVGDGVERLVEACPWSSRTAQARVLLRALEELGRARSEGAGSRRKCAHAGFFGLIIPAAEAAASGSGPGPHLHQHAVDADLPDALAPAVFPVLPWLRDTAFHEAGLLSVAAANGCAGSSDQVHSARMLILDEASATLLDADGTATLRAGLALVIRPPTAPPFPGRSGHAPSPPSMPAGAGRPIGSPPKPWRRWSGPSGRGRAALGRSGPVHRRGLLRSGGGRRLFLSSRSRFRLPVPPPSSPARANISSTSAPPTGSNSRRPASGRGGILEAGACTHCDHALLSFRRDRRSDLRLFNFIGFRRI